MCHLYIELLNTIEDLLRGINLGEELMSYVIDAPLNKIEDIRIISAGA